MLDVANKTTDAIYFFLKFINLASNLNNKNTHLSQNQHIFLYSIGQTDISQSEIYFSIKDPE